MGKYMETMLTTDADFFNDHYVLDPTTNMPKSQINPESMQELQKQDYYRYMKAGNMFLRSQIDTAGEDENGNPIVFEIKTRATAPLRYDLINFIDYLDYHIIKQKGQHSSYEREFYDLIRGGFLKYIMQMKIGRMQGAAIAYHNTQQIFGFEYIKIKDMEKRVFGCEEFADVIFSKSLALMEKIFDYVLEDQQDSITDADETKTYRIGMYANEERGLQVVFEKFENDEIYFDRFRNYYSPTLKDQIDYYLSHKV